MAIGRCYLIVGIIPCLDVGSVGDRPSGIGKIHKGLDNVELGGCASGGNRAADGLGRWVLRDVAADKSSVFVRYDELRPGCAGDGDLVQQGDLAVLNHVLAIRILAGERHTGGNAGGLDQFFLDGGQLDKFFPLRIQRNILCHRLGKIILCLPFLVRRPPVERIACFGRSRIGLTCHLAIVDGLGSYTSATLAVKRHGVRGGGDRQPHGTAMAGTRCRAGTLVFPFLNAVLQHRQVGASRLPAVTIVNESSICLLRCIIRCC